MTTVAYYPNVGPAARLVVTDQLALPFATPQRTTCPAEPGPVARSLVQAVLEVLAGDRPARQLVAVTTERILLDLEGAVARRTRPRPWALSVRSVHVCEPGPGVAEVSAVVVGLERSRSGPPDFRWGATGATRRVRAVALRLERHQTGWVITALSVG
jgi:hypothetical protein